MRRAMRWAVVGLGLMIAAAANGGELSGGVARVDLTPPGNLKAALGGYGARMSRPAEGVHDRVYAKALVLSDVTDRVALVTADVLAFPPGFKSAVLQSLGPAGWGSGQVMLLPSHSHTSIDMTALNPKNTLGIPQLGVFQKELYDLTVANFARVIAEAGRDLTTVLIGTESTRLEGWNRNRRGSDGAVDPELTVTRVDRSDGTPLAVLVNWTAHPTFMDAEDMMFSGGWPGHLQRTVEALIGRNVTAMFYNGAEGDQSPIARPDSGGNWEKAERYGRELGIVVWREWRKIAPKSEAAFSFHSEEIALPEPVWHPDFMKTGGAEYGLNDEAAKQIIEIMAPRTTVSGSLRLGDLLIVGIPGEMTAGLGTSVKSRVRRATGARNVAIGGLADEWISYILAADEYRKGGYEASVSLYGESLGEVIVEGAVRGASRHRR